MVKTQITVTAKATTTATETKETSLTEGDSDVGSRWIDTAEATAFATTRVSDANSPKRTTREMLHSKTRRADVPLAVIDG